MAGGELPDGAISGDGGLHPGSDTNYPDHSHYADYTDYTDRSNHTDYTCTGTTSERINNTGIWYTKIWRHLHSRHNCRPTRF